MTAWALLALCGLAAPGASVKAQQPPANSALRDGSPDAASEQQPARMPAPDAPSADKSAAGKMKQMRGMSGGAKAQSDTHRMQGHTMAGMAMDGMHGMTSALAGVPEMQMASGTSWQPVVSPMFGMHTMSGRWSLMTHYNAFLSYDRQEGPHGDYQFNSTNWIMLMAQRPVKDDRLMFRVMLSLEPLTVTAGGYPLLFQSGEQYHGRALVDRQHPHDLFMELSAKYTHPLGKESAAFLYAAPSGEPALGPTAFPHRMSATDNPIAPISHHWLDSSHIQFGVFTLGAWKRNVQIEGSYFTGREPNEFRYDFAPLHPDSFSGRLSYNPGPNWSLQASYGSIHSPEQLRPTESNRRTTASVTYALPRRDGGFLAAMAGFGNNSSGGSNSDAYLAEADLNIANRNTFFGRFETVNKLGEELALNPANKKFRITEVTLGYLRDFTPNRSYQTGLGAAVTFNMHPGSLDSLYGRSPMGYWVFFRIRPAAMKHGGAGEMGKPMQSGTDNMEGMKH